MLVKIMEIVKYNSHSVKQNGVVDLSLGAMYDEVTNSMQLLQLLNNDISIKAKLPKRDKPIDLGTFRIKDINFHGDGSSVIKLSSTKEAVELNNLNELVVDGYFRVRFSAYVETEQEG